MYKKRQTTRAITCIIALFVLQLFLLINEPRGGCLILLFPRCKRETWYNFCGWKRGFLFIFSVSTHNLCNSLDSLRLRSRVDFLSVDSQWWSHDCIISHFTLRPPVVIKYKLNEGTIRTAHCAGLMIKPQPLYWTAQHSTAATIH